MLIVGGIFVETPGTCYRDVKMVVQMIASLLNISQLLCNHQLRTQTFGSWGEMKIICMVSLEMTHGSLWITFCSKRCRMRHMGQ